MNEEEAEKLLDAADKGFQVAGYASFQEAVAHVYQFAEKLLKLMSNARTRESAKRTLMRGGDIPPEEFEKLLSFLPNVVYAIRKAAPPIIKDIPHPPGGRPDSLTDVQKKQVCAEVLYLHGKKVLLREAITRVAQRYGVSERTIRRAWRDRASE
jgi:hypothetical protein